MRPALSRIVRRTASSKALSCVSFFDLISASMNFWRSGGLLLVSVDNKKKVVEGGGAFAALSFDDGKTWPHLRKIDGIGGYMSLAQAANGVIYLGSGQGGAGVTVGAFNEAWVNAGK